jgi:hypothetical protein
VGKDYQPEAADGPEAEHLRRELLDNSGPENPERQTRLSTQARDDQPNTGSGNVDRMIEVGRSLHISEHLNERRRADIALLV